MGKADAPILKSLEIFEAKTDGNSPMRTVTLELPEDLAARLEAMPPDERNHFATAAMTDRLAQVEDDAAEVAIALQESIADLDAGKGQDLDEYQAERSAFWTKHGL